MYEELKAECESTVLSTLKFEDLKNKLTEIYEPDKGEYSARFIFRERKQNSNGSMQDYVLALKTLSKPCKFSNSELDSQLKDQLISGVASKLVKYELLKEFGKTLKELISLAKTIEIAEGKTLARSKEESSRKDDEALGVHHVTSFNSRRGQPRFTGQQWKRERWANVVEKVITSISSVRSVLNIVASAASADMFFVCAPVKETALIRDRE